MSETLVEKKQDVIIEPFGIEIDAPRNNDVLMQAIPGVRLRSAISASKPVKNRSNGRMVIPQDQASFLGTFPPIPGMQLHVNPKKLSYTIIDPLADDEDLCEQIKRSMDEASTFRSDGKLKGVETQKGLLDVHRMKTLVREMLWLINSDHAKVIKGSAPDMELVERMPGNFLLNPGSRTPNMQPQYECDFESWKEQLARSGG
jgi:hypothetical protein